MNCQVGTSLQMATRTSIIGSLRGYSQCSNEGAAAEKAGSGSQRERAGGQQSSQHGRCRSVAAVCLFTTGGATRTGSFPGGGVGACPRGGGATTVPDCSTVEDITVVGSQAAPSAFHPVVPATSTHISPPSTQPQPCSRRPRIPKKTVKWTNTQLRDAMAAVDGGMSMKKASDLYHIPYSSFREWCYGLRTSRN